MKCVLEFCIFASLLMMISASCSNEILDAQPGEEAVRYYKLLSMGDVDSYLNGIYGIDSMPDLFRKQTREVTKQLADEIINGHQGIDSLCVDDEQINKKGDLANILLRIYFSDGSNERILVPMIKNNDIWYIK